MNLKERYHKELVGKTFVVNTNTTSELNYLEYTFLESISKYTAILSWTFESSFSKSFGNCTYKTAFEYVNGGTWTVINTKHLIIEKY